MSAHVHDYDWIEEPGTYPDGSYSRVLEWVRDCKVCHYSPDRTPAASPHREDTTT